jgi:hypothetical protein
MKKNILIALVAFIYSTIHAQECGNRYYYRIFAQTKVSRDIYFGENLDANGKTKVLKFDVYEPFNDNNRKRIVLVMMHGGAYWSGDKDHGQCKFLGEDLSKMGYVVISPQYRYEPTFLSLLNEEKMVKAVARGTQDAKAMLRYLYKDVRENGNTWGIDTNLIFVGGASAGSFNALHAVYLDNDDELPQQWWDWINEVGGIDGNSGNPGYPAKVKGVINISGALARKEILNNETIPFLSVHDVGDPQIPFGTGKPYNIPSLPTVDGSSTLHAKAKELGLYNPFLIIPGNGHTSYEELGIRIQPNYDSTLKYVRDFMYTLYCGSRTITSVHLSELSDITIYPNPSKGTFRINGSTDQTSAKNLQISIFNLSGSMMKEINQYQFGQEIVADLPSGQYHLILTEGDRPLAKGSFHIVK